MGNTKRGKSLKDSLSTHQKRQTHNALSAAKQAAISAKGKQAAKAERVGGSAKKVKRRKGVAGENKYTIPFSVEDRILLIGEGNFSFAHSLLEHPSIPHLPPSNITATAYDTEPECLAKYPDAASHISALRSAGAVVLFGIDARQLDKTVGKSGKKWDKVVWNFPHVGLGIADRDRNVVANQSVLLGFLKSVKGVLQEGAVPGLQGKRKGKGRIEDEVEFSDDEYDDGGGRGTGLGGGEKRAGSVLVTLREQEPYTLWDLPRLAKRPIAPTTSRTALPQPRYIQTRSFAFHVEAYPGYEHRRTSGGTGTGEGGNFEGGPCRTWEFVLRPDEVGPNGGQD
ncbi:hypothetical protein BDV93DRAFT_491630 [Ceratobasidium sp. AG-I]|nr:hypothetical protein BDV93DRAFT_491630 [Ceratobasidium sp. AG-I]